LRTEALISFLPFPPSLSAMHIVLLSLLAFAGPTQFVRIASAEDSDRPSQGTCMRAGCQPETTSPPTTISKDEAVFIQTKMAQKGFVAGSNERGSQAKGDPLHPSTVVSNGLPEFKAALEMRENFFEEAIKNHSLSSSELSAHAEFKQFLRTNVRHYFHKNNVSEYVQRLKNFRNSILKAGVRNAVEKATSTHERRAIHGITKFADWHDHEVQALVEGSDVGPTENASCAHVVEAYGCGLELEVMAMDQVCPEECQGTPPVTTTTTPITTTTSTTPRPPRPITTTTSTTPRPPRPVSLADDDDQSRRRRRHDHDHHDQSRRRRRRHDHDHHDDDHHHPSPSPTPLENGSPDSGPTESPTGSCKNWGSHLEVRSQGQCGDCWAFSTVESIRVLYAAQHGEDPGKLSTQFLVDCMEPGKVCYRDPSSGHMHHEFLTGPGPHPHSIDGKKVSDMPKNGCCGGHINEAMDFIRDQGGIPTQADYGDINTSSISHGITLSGIDPTHAYPCKQGIRKAVTTTGHVKLETEDAMASYICDTGPISIAVKTGSWASTYKGGVVSSSSCGEGGHSVLLVGLNKGDNAWIVQNSWGSNYGVTLDGKALPSNSVHRDYLHGSYCSHLVEQGCSMTVADAIDAIHKVMQFDLPGKWESNGKTVADECPESCAGLSEKGGYIYMEFGKDVCTITHAAFVANSTARP